MATTCLRVLCGILLRDAVRVPGHGAPRSPGWSLSSDRHRARRDNAARRCARTIRFASRVRDPGRDLATDPKKRQSHAGDDLCEQLIKYLTDVHGSEENAVRQLKAGADSVEHKGLAAALREHLTESEEHERLVRERLKALGASPSTLKDVAQQDITTVTGAVAGAAPDTTGKVAIRPTRSSTWRSPPTLCCA